MQKLIISWRPGRLLANWLPPPAAPELPSMAGHPISGGFCPQSSFTDKVMPIPDLSAWSLSSSKNYIYLIFLLF